MLHNEYKKFFDLDKIADEIESYLPDFDRKRFIEAFDFAAKAHEGQFRKDKKTPYISHPVEALKTLTSLRADEDSLISCLLHDVPEDTEYTIEDIEKRFGKKVAFLVDGITKLSKVQYKHNMPARQVGSLKKLLFHSAKDLRVLLIKLADRMHNMKTLDNIKKAEKRLRIATETLEIYVPIANLLGIREVKSKLEDLCFKYMFPTEYTQIRGKIVEQECERKKLMKDFKREISKIAKKEDLAFRVEERTKNLFSIFNYLKDEGKKVVDIDNRIGVRLITGSNSDCYRLLGAIHNHFMPVMNKFKDYIASPKLNGYKSLHTTVFDKNGALVEIHIRTEKMHTEAEYGIAAHFFEENHLNAEFENIFWGDAGNSKWMQRISEISREEDDSSQEFLNNLKEDLLRERIIVLTRRGVPVDLPKGATGIDYAFIVNPKLALKIIGIEVNAVRKSITTELKTQEVIRLVVNKEKTVDLSWLNFAHTKEAKKGIIDYFKESRPDTKFVKGREILQQELDIENLGLIENLSFRKLRKRINERYGEDFDSLRSLLIAIGCGDLQAKKVIKVLRGSNFSERGLDKRRINIKVIANDRFGLSKDVYEVIYKYVDDVTFFKGWFSAIRKKAFFVITVAISDDKGLSRLFDELKRIDSVEMVYRTSPFALSFISLIGVLISLLWLGHPFVVNEVINSSVYANNPNIINGGVNISILLMFMMMVIFLKIIDRYFPSMRFRRRMMAIMFVLPLAMVATLMFEVDYFGLRFDWGIIVTASVAIYSYLLYQYWNHRPNLKI